MHARICSFTVTEWQCDRTNDEKIEEGLGIRNMKLIGRSMEGRGEKNARMIMRQTNQVDPRQIMEVDSWVRKTGPSDARTEMDVVSCVEEIL